MTTIQPWRRPIFNNAVIAEQERICFELRLRGMSIRAIADYVATHHGWPLSKSTVALRIEAAGKDATSELADQVRALELERLDRLTSIVIETMDKAYARDMFGRVIKDVVPGTENDETPAVEPVRDHAVVYAGVDRLLKISERRAKYVGGLEKTGPVEVVVHDAESTRERLAVQELVNEARAMAAAQAGAAQPTEGETSEGV